MARASQGRPPTGRAFAGQMARLMSLAFIRSCVRGVGAALPVRVVKNFELATKVDTSDEWIRQRTGIRQRYVAGEGETTSTLATKAAQAALTHGRLSAADIDLVIIA